MGESPMGSNKAPGRPLPQRVEDITSTKVNDATKQLILEVLTLVKARFSSVRDMIRFAMDQPERPVWAVGSPANQRHLSSAGSAVSKFLGKAAERAPDWPSLDWIVRACTPADQHEQLLARMAGRWCSATGMAWPPGYVGEVEHGENAVERLTDPHHAPDDTTRAQLYHQQLQNTQAATIQLLQDKQELHLQVEALTACTAHAGKRIRDLEQAYGDLQKAYRAKDAELGEKVLANRRRFEQHLELMQSEHAVDADRARRANERLEQVIHHLAVLAAHLVTHQATKELLPIPGLAVDTELRDLLDPPTPPDTPAAAWLAVYLRAIVLLHHGLNYPAALSTVAENLTTVIAHGGLPDHNTINALLDTHPMLRAYAGPLYRAAHAEHAGRPAPLTTVDTRPPSQQRLQDADTVQVQPRRKPAATNNLTPTTIQPPTTLPHSQQITVAELLARHNGPPPRRRHRRATPPLDNSG